MNKIKFLYDVVRTMKDKQNLQGEFRAEAKRDQVKVFGCANEFFRNTVTGEGRLKVSTEFNWDGQTMKHESCTQFNMKDGWGAGCHGRHAALVRRLHCHPGMGPGAMEGRGPVPGHFHPMHGGFKGGLSRAAFLLHVLNSINVEENADQSYLLTLELTDLPEDLKKDFQEKIQQHRDHAAGMRQHFAEMGREVPGFMKELHTLEQPAVNVKLQVNRDYEVETVDLEFGGKVSDESQTTHEVAFKAQLKLVD